MKRPLSHPTVEAVKAIHAEVLAAHGGGAGLREEALLESAVAAPQATMAGEPLFADPLEIAAAYLFYLCRNHPFVDGNKRTGFVLGVLFLELNGFRCEAGEAEAAQAVLALASGAIDEAGYAGFLRANAAPS
jgi:death-on-curing protein